MKYEIEIDHRDWESVIFYVGDTPYTVEIETEMSIEEYPNSYDSFTDTIHYTREEVYYYYVKEETLECDGVNYYDERVLCIELEKMLNQ